jgi:hypothetical protein
LQKIDGLVLVADVSLNLINDKVVIGYEKFLIGKSEFLFQFFFDTNVNFPYGLEVANWRKNVKNASYLSKKVDLI